jgi:hypothetical protein
MAVYKEMSTTSKRRRWQLGDSGFWTQSFELKCFGPKVLGVAPERKSDGVSVLR